MTPAEILRLPPGPEFDRAVADALSSWTGMSLFIPWRFSTDLYSAKRLYDRIGDHCLRCGDEAKWQKLIDGISPHAYRDAHLMSMILLEFLLRELHPETTTCEPTK